MFNTVPTWIPEPGIRAPQMQRFLRQGPSLQQVRIPAIKIRPGSKHKHSKQKH